MLPHLTPRGADWACGVSTVSLGGSVVRDCFLHLLSILLILLSLPFLAVSFVVAALCAAVAAMFPRYRRQRRVAAIDPSRLRSVDEFAFNGALNDYEQLLDAHAWKQQ